MHVSWRWLSLLTGVLITGPARPGLLTAQQAAVTISGRVTNDAGAPLTLASVYIEALGLGTQTAEDGRYQLTVPAARVTGQQVTLGVRAIGFRNTTALITLTELIELTSGRILPLGWATDLIRPAFKRQ